VNRRVAINLTFFMAVFVVMAVWATRNVVTIEALERPYEMTVELERSSGIGPRAEVAYLGVGIGEIGKVERVPGGVVATMKIRRGERIPVGSTANVYRKSAIGEPYIDLFPPSEGVGDAFHQAGDVIPVELTTNPLEFSEMLRSASRLVSGIDPDRLRVLVHELAVALHGRSDQLRSLTESSARLASTFADRTEVLDRLATNNTRLTRVMAEHRGSLGQQITDLRHLAESLDRAKGDTTVLLDRGTRLLREAGDLVADQKGNLDCILSGLEATIEVASSPERVADLRRFLQVGPVGLARPFEVRDVLPDGVWVRVGVVTNPSNPPRQYVPPVPVPEAPAVPPCDSDLRPVGVQSASAPAPASTAPPVQTLGFAGGLAAAAAAVVVRLSGRR
jgi:phospholipid/cholesterol/gamma-HCH transport system substrate-binding protein